MINIGWALMVIVFIRLLTAILNYLTMSLIKLSSADGKKNLPSLSVLIPARNEEKNILNLLNDLSKLSYPDMEIIVYDDLSNDKTAEIVTSFIKNKKNFSLIDGLDLPTGWLGKNNACFQMANQAKGNYLLFLDADVRIKDGILDKAVNYQQKQRLKLLSIFPKQLMFTTGEKLTVPLMNWILLSLLPLILIRICRWPVFSAANGQFLLFETATYRKHLPHKKFRKHRVEDIAIMHYYKNKKEKVAVLLGEDSISCRMYKSYNDAINGFSKNIFHFFGGSKLLTLTFVIITTLSPLILLIINGLVPFLIYISAIIFIRIFTSLSSRQSICDNVFLMPLQQFSLIRIIFAAINKRNLLWKERPV